MKRVLDVANNMRFLCLQIEKIRYLLMYLLSIHNLQK